MKFDIQGGTNFPVLNVTLQKGEEFVAESGAMCWMTANMKSTVSTRGGLLSGLKRKVLGGESLFQNTYFVEDGEGTVSFVPGQPGSIVHRDLSREGEIYLESGGYLASSSTVKIDTKFQGLKGIFGEGMFAIRVHGEGHLFFGGYGEIMEVDVRGEYIVDSGYAVAWEPSLNYKIGRSGKKVRSFLFGDQLISRFSGEGKLWVQTYCPAVLANWFWPFRRQRNNN